MKRQDRQYTRRTYEATATVIRNLDVIARDVQVTFYADLFARDNPNFDRESFVRDCVPPVIEVTAAGKRALLVGRNDPARGIHHRMGGVQMTDTEFRQAQEAND